MGAAQAILVSLILLITGAGPSLAQLRAVPVDLELILAVDVSGSVDEEEARLQRDGYVAAIADPEIIRAITSGMLGRIAVTYFEWAGDTWQVPVLPWTLIDSPQTAQAFAAKLAAAPLGSGPWTSISDAIRTASKQSIPANSAALFTAVSMSRSEPARVPAALTQRPPSRVIRSPSSSNAFSSEPTHAIASVTSMAPPACLACTAT